MNICSKMKACNVCGTNPKEIGLRCRPCHNRLKREREKARRASDPSYAEHVRKENRKRYYAHHSRNKELKRKNYNSLPTNIRQQRSKNNRKNFKEKCQSIPGYRGAFNAWQRAYRNLRLPKWVNLEDFVEIYAAAAAKGDNFVVDHKIPLRGSKVSGLHVPQNLQILTKTQNLEKGNKYEPE